MSTSVNQAFVERFSSRVHHLGQQRMSRLRSTVYQQSDRANIYNFDRLADAAMVGGGARHATITPLNIAHSRRKATVETWDWTELVDRRDAVRVLQNPGSEYEKAAAKAYGRQVDIIIATAVESDSKTTDGAGAPVALPAGQVIGNGTGALSLDYLRQAKRKLDEAEVGDEAGGERYCAINAKGLEDLLKVTEVTSSDYAAVKALVDGSLNSYLGFNFIRTELLPAGTPQGKWQFQGDNVTGVGMLCWERNCVGLAISDDRFTRIGENAERKFSLQVYCELTMGAARIEDEGVVVIDIAQ